LTRIFLIRHAEAEGNLYRRAHGQQEGLVTARGRQQIGLLRERFKDEIIDAVYSSDLTRARETAKALGEPRGLPVITNSLLREVNMGAWEDRPWGELEYLEPQNHADFASDPAKWIVSGGETYLEVMARVTGCIKEIASRHNGETIAIVSHGFAIRVFLCGVLGLQSHEALKVLYCDNTAVALLHYDDGNITIEYQSDNSHLNAENSTFAHQYWWRAEKKWRSENFRYLPYDEARDSGIRLLLREETGIEPAAETEYTVFLVEEAAGLLGIDDNSQYTIRNSQFSDSWLRESVSNENTGWISYLYLKPEYRRRNFSVQLLGQAISEFRRIGKEFIRIEAQTDSPAYKLCLKDGFEILSEADGMCLMQKSLRI